jgi:hypothetical protein
MDNPYAPPVADPVVAGGDGGDDRLGLYTISARKFWVLTSLTAGLYSIAWGYQHWAHLKRRDRSGIWPVPRAIFMVFYTHALVRRAAGLGAAAGRWTGPPPSGLATAAVAAMLLSVAITWVPDLEHGQLLLAIIALAMIWVVGWATWGIQAVINAIAADPRGAANDRFSIGNWIWMGIGLALWGVSILMLVELAVGPEAG